MIYVIDTETNGRTEKELEVIELAYQVVNPGSWDALTSFSVERFKPKQGSTNGALAAHHILDAELAECPASGLVKIPADATYIIGHNVDYDWEALGKPNVKRICTLALARAHYEGEQSHTLGAMTYMTNPPARARELLKNAHSAGADVEMCLSLLAFILRDKNLLFSTAEELWVHSEACRVPRLMPFGKYYKQPIRNMPHEYKTWCLKQKDMDPYVLRAIRESL